MKGLTRIAFLSEHASPIALLGGADAGGQNVYVDEVSRSLAAGGYAVDIFTRRDHPTTPEVVNWACGVRVINISAGPATPLAKDTLWQYMPQFRDGCLNFMERHELRYDLLHGNFWMSGWVASELRQRLRIPAVQIFHALGVTKRRHQGSADSSPAERIQVERQIVQDMDCLVAPCPNEQIELIEDYGADPAKIQVIPLAVNTEIFRPVEKEEARKILGLNKEEFVIVYVGRMLPRKDVRNIVQALARLLQRGEHSLPRCTLLLVGGETAEPDPMATPEIGELQRLAAELGVLEHIRFCGNQQQERLRYYYSAGDVVVTTPWYEPFGLTPLEGMACARPVIGANVGGLSYTIRDGETGYLVPPRDPVTLAERLCYLLRHPQEGVRMGEAARARVEQEFTWPLVAARTANLYERLLAQSPDNARPLLLEALWPAMLDTPSVGGGE